MAGVQTEGSEELTEGRCAGRAGSQEGGNQAHANTHTHTEGQTGECRRPKRHKCGSNCFKRIKHK